MGSWHFGRFAEAELVQHRSVGLAGKRQLIQIQLHVMPARLNVEQAKAVEPGALCTVDGIDLKHGYFVIKPHGNAAQSRADLRSVIERPRVNVTVRPHDGTGLLNLAVANSRLIGRSE